jgi:hypothetical protein
MSRFSIHQQRLIIRDLIDHPGPMKFGLPNDSDVRRLRQLLINEVLSGEAIAHVDLKPCGMEIITTNNLSLYLKGAAYLSFPQISDGGNCA